MNRAPRSGERARGISFWSATRGAAIFLVVAGLLIASAFPAMALAVRAEETGDGYAWTFVALMAALVVATGWHSLRRDDPQPLASPEELERYPRASSGRAFGRQPLLYRASAIPPGMAGTVFQDEARAAFAAAYPCTPTHLTHQLTGHPLLELEALAALAGRMRPESREWNAAVGLKLGIRNDETPANGLSAAETIERIGECGSWVLLKTIDQDPLYAALMRDVLAEIEPVVMRSTGPMLRLEGFIFISSPEAVTPLHFDPEYNILFQARGSKTMTVFPIADPDIIGDPFFEQYFAGGPRNLPWKDEWAARGTPIHIEPGEAIYVPILAPHWVQTHGEVSVSLSLTWRSEWSFHHADACRLNRRLRARGLRPASPRLYPASNRLKSYAERALARIERARRSA